MTAYIEYNIMKGKKTVVCTFDLASMNLIPLTDTDSVTEGIFCSLAVDS